MDSTANISVSDIMQREVLTVENDWPLDQLARFLTDNQISGAPVIAENGNLLGVVSLTDIVRHEGTPESHAAEHGTHEYYLHGLEMQVGQNVARAFHIEEESSVRSCRHYGQGTHSPSVCNPAKPHRGYCDSVGHSCLDTRLNKSSPPQADGVFR
jgi:hypothetical protein